MKKSKKKVICLREYKQNKKQLELDRKELLKLIKKAVTTK